jgi:hypothetical protein
MAAEAYRNGELPAERVRIYEKVRSGIWVYNGVFRLVDAWQQDSDGRSVFKFKLELTDEEILSEDEIRQYEPEHTRMIPTDVKREVWKRDQSQCGSSGWSRGWGSAENPGLRSGAVPPLRL